MAKQRSPDSALSCLCSTCQTCRHRYYARLRADKQRQQRLHEQTEHKGLELAGWCGADRLPRHKHGSKLGGLMSNGEKRFGEWRRERVKVWQAQAAERAQGWQVLRATGGSVGGSGSGVSEAVG